MSRSIFNNSSLFDIPICPSGIFPTIGEEKLGDSKESSWIILHFSPLIGEIQRGKKTMGLRL